MVSRCHANLYLSKGLSLTLCAALYLFTNMSSISDVTSKSHKQISSAVSEPNCWAQLLLKNVRYLELGQSSYLEFISASSICNLEFSMSFKQHAPTKSLMYFFIFPWRFSVSGGYHIMSDGDPGPIRHFVWWNTKLFRLHWIWKWFKEPDWYFRKIKKFLNEKLTNTTSVAPTPRPKSVHRSQESTKIVVSCSWMNYKLYEFNNHFGSRGQLAWGLSQYKKMFYQYKDSHYKDKTILSF